MGDRGRRSELEEDVPLIGEEPLRAERGCEGNEILCTLFGLGEGGREREDLRWGGNWVAGGGDEGLDCERRCIAGVEEVEIDLTRSLCGV